MSPCSRKSGRRRSPPIVNTYQYLGTVPFPCFCCQCGLSSVRARGFLYTLVCTCMSVVQGMSEWNLTKLFWVTRRARHAVGYGPIDATARSYINLHTCIGAPLGIEPMMWLVWNMESYRDLHLPGLAITANLCAYVNGLNVKYEANEYLPNACFETLLVLS